MLSLAPFFGLLLAYSVLLTLAHGDIPQSVGNCTRHGKGHIVLFDKQACVDGDALKPKAVSRFGQGEFFFDPIIADALCIEDDKFDGRIFLQDVHHQSDGSTQEHVVAILGDDENNGAAENILHLHLGPNDQASDVRQQGPTTPKSKFPITSVRFADAKDAEDILSGDNQPGSCVASCDSHAVVLVTFCGGKGFSQYDKPQQCNQGGDGNGSAGGNYLPRDCANT